jgi:hypothetical protein
MSAPSPVVCRPEAVAFWALALLHLVPVWAFRYLPTQDGPAHLDNAQILKDYGDPAAGYQPFYELRREPLPNLMSHLLLAGLLYLFPPLVAEKVLVSLYVLGFAASFRYFLGAFGARCRPLSWAGLLLVYNRCFWMGFYNYCLGLILVWVILGYCLRRRQTLSLPRALALLLLFVAAYFTHLFAFLLAVAGTVAAAVLVPPRRVHALVLTALAVLPSACLAMDYFEQTGFSRAVSVRRLLHDSLDRLPGGRCGADFGKRMAAIDDELFAHHLGTDVPGTLVLTAYLAVLAALAVASRSWEEGVPGPVFPAAFAVLLLGAYLVVPEHLGADQGGFLRTRLAPLPFLLGLACLREPAAFGPRLVVRGLTAYLLAVNLLLVAATVRSGNAELDVYTAGMEAVGGGHRLFVVQKGPGPGELVNPLLHAAHYYCLGMGNVDLDNYEATTPHFPVRYRRGMGRGRNDWAGYPHQAAVDVVLCWQARPPAADGSGPASWDEVFRRGPLTIYRRPGVVNGS